MSIGRSWWAVVGLLAVAWGAALFVERNGGADEIVAIGRRWWPLLLIAVGFVNLIRLSDRRWAVVGPFLAIVTGTALLLFIVGPVPGNIYPRLWPIVLVLAGGLLVLSATRPNDKELAERPEVHRFVWLGGERLQSTARSFWHARINVLLGTFTLDLQGATLHQPATVYVNAVFGTVDILVDAETTATVRRPFVLRVRGLVPSDVPPDEHPQLTVSVLALFGDAKIRRSLGIAPLASPGSR
jgi:peptidoglycan/LPS O-acetylase OafA/YrhL